MRRAPSPHRLRARYFAIQTAAGFAIQVTVALAILLAAAPVALGAIVLLPTGLGVAALVALSALLAAVAWLALRGKLETLSNHIFNWSSAAAHALIDQPSRCMPLPFGELFVSGLHPWVVELIVPGDEPGQRLSVGAAVPVEGGGFRLGDVVYATWTEACRALVFRAGTRGATAHQRLALQRLLLDLPADAADWPFRAEGAAAEAPSARVA